MAFQVPKRREQAWPEAARVRQRTLIFIRWIAVSGQLISILTVHFSLDIPVPLAPVLGVVGLSILVNLGASLLTPAATRLSNRDAALYLGYDVLQLALLVALTGGLENPFSLLFLVPVTIAATILKLRATAALCALVVVCVTLVARYHWPLPWQGEPFAPPPLYLIALWVAMVLGTIMIAAYTWRVAAEARRMATALSATQMALAREHRVSALGALAAAAAHELGTPLATIAVAAREIERDLPAGSPSAEDAQLLGEQVARCREILGRLSGLDTDAGESTFGSVPLTVLVEETASVHRRRGVAIDIAPGAENTGAEPNVPRRAELLHGLGNFIENATQFGRTSVALSIVWTAEHATIRLRDDGPGFPPGLIPSLGEPYVSTRREEGRMGLGIFIAKTVLEQTGATVSFANGKPGAEVTIRWSRAALDALGPDLAEAANGDQGAPGSRA
jgi:two-component system sensor histidine kinase RegB